MVRNTISTDEIVAALNRRADTLAPKLLPNGMRIGRHWATSNINDHKTGSYSLKVTVAGAGKGLWTDFATTKGMPEHGGNMLQLVALTRFGGTHQDAYRDAIAWAKSELGYDDLDPERLKRVQREIADQQMKDDAAARQRVQRMRDKARHLWFDAVEGQGTPAEFYLRGRGIDLRGMPPEYRRWPRALRYHPGAWCSETDGPMPCMVAAIFSIEGEMLAVHRTYLDIRQLDQGIVRKAQLADAKLTMGTYAGGHLPLWKGLHSAKLAAIPHGTDVFVSEGIEDGLSIAMAFPERRIVAGVALANIGGMQLPDQAGRLVLIGQNDENPKTIEAVEASIARQQKAGRKVATIFPRPEFKDFNDQLCGKRMKVGA
jgi:hypothetical protein